MVQVSDTDIGSNGEVDFSLESTVQGLFSLVVTEPFATQLHFSHSIDREVRDVYSFRIFATDRGTPTLIGQTEILINITVRDCYSQSETHIPNKTVHYNMNSKHFQTSVFVRWERGVLILEVLTIVLAL